MASVGTTARRPRTFQGDATSVACALSSRSVTNASVNMFRDGQYLEVIKVSNNCLATAVVTVQERTVKIKKQKVTTNKWLQVEDWVALYKILERAVLQNGQSNEELHRKDHKCKWRKSTRELEVTYTFEPSECADDTTSLPTIKVHVSPARKRSKRETSEEASKKTKTEARMNNDLPKQTKEEKSLDQTTDIKSDQLNSTAEKQISTKKRKYMPSYDNLENASLEEYIPDAPKRPYLDFKYIPSQKSALENMQLTSNEYTPTPCVDSKSTVDDVTDYVPNSIEKLETTYETYEPCATTLIPNSLLEEYVPNSKGVKSFIEEYEPDFKSPNKMRFDDSYVPSSTRQSCLNDTKRTPDKLDKLKTQKLEARRKGTPAKKRMEDLFS